MYATVRGNIAGIYLRQNKVIEAQKLIAENHSVYFKLSDTLLRIRKKHMSSGINLTNTYINQGNYTKAENLLTDLEQKLDTFTLKERTLLTINLLKTKHNLAIKKRDYKKAHHLLEQIDQKKDNLKVSNEKQNQTIAKQLDVITHKKFEIQLANEQLQQNKEIQEGRIRFWIVTLILTLIAGTFLILYNRFKQRAEINENKKTLAEQKAQAKTLENQLLHQNIENQKKDLSNFAITTKQNKDWLVQLSHLVADLKSKNNINRDQAIKELDSAIKDKQRINTFTEDLQQQVEQLNTDFYHKLNTAFPSLTPYELKLCSLLRINLGTKDIATLLNISPSSVNTSRYRLRKKLQLDKSQDLTEHLKSY